LGGRGSYSFENNMVHYHFPKIKSFEAIEYFRIVDQKYLYMNKMSLNKCKGIKSFINFSMIFDFVKFLILIGILFWLLAIGTRQLGYHWQWYRVPKFLFTVVDGNFIPGPLLQGLWVTFRIAATSFLLFLIFGITAALLRQSSFLSARTVARIYLELIRNTPLLIQLFFIYFAISPLLGISAFFSAVLALSLFEGAYASEIIRAGIYSINKGQWEAAYSLGFSTFDTYRYIIFPQVIRQISPPLTGQTISLIKDSSLVSTIAIYDLTMQGQAIVAETFLAFEIWFTVAAIYLIINITLSSVMRVMENRMRME
jgi:polar amino acid transport system permease protein